MTRVINCGAAACGVIGVSDPIQGPATIPGEYALRRHPAYIGDTAYIGADEDGTVTGETGWPLGDDDTIILHLRSLSELWLTADAPDVTVQWIRLSDNRTWARDSHKWVKP